MKGNFIKYRSNSILMIKDKTIIELAISYLGGANKSYMTSYIPVEVPESNYYPHH